MSSHLLKQKGSVVQEKLADITEIKIDTTLPPQERMNDFLSQIKNPYYFKCQDIVVKVQFNCEGDPLDKLLIDYFARENNK